MSQTTNILLHAKGSPPFIPASDGSYLGAKNFVKRETHERAVSFKTNYK